MQPEVDSRSRPTGEASVTFGIGELEARTGVPASTIRYYERVGLLDAPDRIGGKRRFGDAAERRLGAVRLCIAAGFSLDESRVLLADDSPDREVSRALAARKLGEIDARLEVLAGARVLIERGLHCRCLALECCACDA